MILAYDVADHAGALLGGPVVGVGHLRLCEENAAVHGLEAVTGIGNGSTDDDAERIGQIGLAQLFFYIDFEFCHGRNPLGKVLRNVPRRTGMPRLRPRLIRYRDLPWKARCG